jgi:hypothetical protein
MCVVWPNIFLQEDMISHSRHSIVCFEEVVVLGHTGEWKQIMFFCLKAHYVMCPLSDILCFVDISSPFISSPLEATAFQAHMLASLPPSSALLASHPRHALKRMTMGSSPSLLTQPARATRQGLKEGSYDRGGVRVTLALRGSGRKILNLEKVLARIESIGVVDTQWLRKHIVDMEVLSFQKQVSSYLLRHTS